MANYDYTAIGILGVCNGTSIKARVGHGLLQKLLRYGVAGVAEAQDPDFPLVVLAALPTDFKCWIHNYGLDGSVMLQPAGATDWGGLAAEVDLNGTSICDVYDPAFLVNNPAPTLATWATAFGGTVDQSGGR